MEKKPSRSSLKQRIAELEQTLKMSSARYSALFEIAADALFIENDQDEILDVNQKACDLLGYSREELRSMKVCDIQAPECRGEAGCILLNELTDHRGKPFETVDLHKDGTRIPVEVTNNRLDEGGLFLSIVRDIRERKLDEQVREETYNIIDKSPVVAFLWRNATHWPVEFVTRNVVRIFGYTGEEFLSGKVLYSSVVHPDDLDRVAAEVATYSKAPSRTEFTHEPYRIIDNTGTTHWVNDHTFIRRDHNGTITHYQGIIEDITDQRRAAEQLAAEKERLSVTLHSIGDAVITTDHKGRIVLMNPVAEALTGWRAADAEMQPLGKVFRIIDERTRQACASPLEKVLSTGQIVGLANHTVLIAKDGRESYIADSGAPIKDTRGEIVGVVLVFRDITVQQRMENELLKMEKLQSLGVLAGGIAHDFNNFLTGIIGNLSLAKLELHPGHPASRALNEMEKAAIRAKDLTQQLLTFSKGGAPVRRTASIANLAREAVQFALRGSNVKCDFKMDDDLQPVDIDEGQIAQVLHNLMINADQAMPDGGTACVRAVNVTLSVDNPFALDAGDYVKLSIQDQGVGIQLEFLKKVFDPYFSTKQKGSGLGLAVAYSIITKHDGQLSVDSTLGQGATFTILLPASEGKPLDRADDQQALLPGDGRILVMDDEAFIRELAAVLLDKMGYAVALAEDGESAIALYREAQETGRPFDAVILDLTVPGGMGGRKTMQKLQAIDPTVRAIVSSGYSNDPVMAEFASYGFRGAVKKPYQVQEMSHALHAVIND